MRPTAAIVVVACCVAAGGSRVTAAQSSGSCPSTTAEPYLVCQVDRAPAAAPGNPAPRYPDMLLRAHVTGTARVRFVVDSAGHVPYGSFTVVESTHDLFSHSAKSAVPKWTFTPATLRGRPVATRYEQLIAFSLPSDSNAPFLPPTVLASDTAPGGVPRIVIGTPDREPGASLQFTNAELLDAQRAVLVALAPAPMVDSAGRSRVTVCLTRERGDQEGDTALLQALTVPGRRAVILRDCPRTYARMPLDLEHRPPPGWIDPVVMSVARVDEWTASIVVLDVGVSQGTGTHKYRCAATRDPSGWRTDCTALRVPFS